MTKNLQSSHQVLDSDLGYYIQRFLVQQLTHLFFFPEFSSNKLIVIQFLISTIHSVSFANWCVSLGHEKI